MSRDTVVAKRYAKALYSAAVDEGITLEVEAQLRLVVEVLHYDAEVKQFILAPRISQSDKLNVLRGALKGKVSEAVMNMVELLVERGRTDIFAELLATYVKIEGDALGIGDATVYSAYSLNQEEQDSVAAEFSQLTNRKIRVTNVVDKSLLGGLKVIIGDTLYDGSLSGKLERLEKSFNDKQRR
ncbi:MULTISPECIES: F0F1 ATP synthase subunit delta [Paenibacillus]|jgi:F-type H+-transporting ATPase subunit delta|uniref:ATP synthase subunit delta n=2 Tax=Paenibacillus TaxID=44249 RepID=A0A089MY43_PAEBO|nr:MULTISPECIES: F0F1 ATP synthase subunit delta [Paenibacillus]AIQ32748.1 ATP synthase F0F1 subunit delta [Paenibacillus sp. FSL P4-0081]AIQ44053.1 ATP synthase F0F1 subunit delta [Paenibacillus sp. FSL R5-0912]AIQ61319.1 ATP synthase F0F1 subunit delta [Paenibacillus borealis]NOU79288.1 F0F1 ATP synthase subunit delta [Paenibacillus phytohabitans]OMF24228.1 ATP synthase F1 subunit delta [Paenibacillus sp. FSL H8-0259]